MEAQKYLEGTLQEATTKVGRGQGNLLAAMAVRIQHYAPRAMLAVRVAAEDEGIDVKEVERLFMAQSFYELASFASAFAAIHKTQFDPEAFGRHAEAIAREFAPIFAEVEAEEDSKTATHN